MTRVRCDRCGKRFAPRLVEWPLPSGCVREEFRCPHCRHVYPVATITAAGLAIRQQIQTATGAQLADLRQRMAQEVRQA